MRRLVVLVVLMVGFGAAPVGADDGRARLTVVAPVGMPFVSMGLNPDIFVGGRTWQNLKPGTYVVVQAPPLPGGLSVSCSNGDALTITLDVDDDVTCTFVSLP